MAGAACAVLVPCGAAAVAIAGGGTLAGAGVGALATAVGYGTAAGIAATGLSAGIQNGIAYMNQSGWDSGDDSSSGECPEGNFAETGYSKDEIARFANSHVGDENPAMGRPSLREIEEALNSGKTSPGKGDSVRYDYGSVRVIVNRLNPLRSTAYYRGGAGG